MNIPSKVIDLSGQKFGRLIALEYVGITNHRNAKWKCKCDCGNIIVTDSGSLRQRKSNSCGCLNIEKIRKIGNSNVKYSILDAGLHSMYSQTQHSAQRRNIDFELSYDEFKNLSLSKCYYCNSEPMQHIYVDHKRKHTQNHEYYRNGIDRVDNLKGYTTDNCVPCCKKCNSMKNSITVEMARKIVSFIEVK